MWLEDMDEEELKESIYHKVRQNIPKCLCEESKIEYEAGVRLLLEFLPKLRGSTARQLVRHVLEMDSRGKGHEHPWPSRLADQVPGLEEYLSDADQCGPGCAITWHEDDEISACFDEEMS